MSNEHITLTVEPKKKQTFRQSRAEQTQRRAERVEHIVWLMRTLKWEVGKTSKHLVQKWDISKQTMVLLEREASSLIANDYSPESVRHVINVRLARILRTGSDKDAVRAADVAAKLHGQYAAQQITIKHELETKTDDEVEEMLLLRIRERFQRDPVWRAKLLSTITAIAKELPP